MSAAKRIYDLIASQQAMSTQALMLATGMSEAMVRSNIYFLRKSGRIERTTSRPAAYEAIATSEPPRAYKPRGPRAPVIADPVRHAIRTQPNSVFALGAA